MLNFDELSTTIASLCEDWYLQERGMLAESFLPTDHQLTETVDGRDSLVPSTLTYLLVKSIHSGAKPAGKSYYLILSFHINDRNSELRKKYSFSFNLSISF